MVAGSSAALPKLGAAKGVYSVNTLLPNLCIGRIRFPESGEFRGAAQDRQKGYRFHPSGQGKVPVIRLGQSSSGKRMVITGSP
jgi:hypothetical protein